MYGIARTDGLRDIRVDSSSTAAHIAATSDRSALIQKRFADHFVQAGQLSLELDVEVEIEQALYVLLAETPERRKPETILFRDWLLENHRER